MYPCQEGVPIGMPGGFFIYNAQDNEEIIFADPNVIRLFGCESMEEFREYVGNSFRGMIHPEDVDAVENDIMAQTFKSGKRHDYVRYRIITKQGDIRYLEDFGHLLHAEVFCATNSPSADGNRKLATCAAAFVRSRQRTLPYAKARPGG